MTSALPLMGIKSRFLRRIAAQAGGRLITPHGIENSLYRLTHKRQAICSLPLMGIENVIWDS